MGVPDDNQTGKLAQECRASFPGAFDHTEAFQSFTQPPDTPDSIDSKVQV
jgi:hypothetical protein